MFLLQRFLVPGWRLGWIIIYDRNHVFDQVSCDWWTAGHVIAVLTSDWLQEIRRGLMCMSQRIIGSNTFIQGALPTILKNTPKSFFENAIDVIKKNADLAFTKLRNTPGLIPIMPRGAMYMMVKVIHIVSRVGHYLLLASTMEITLCPCAHKSIIALFPPG